MKDCRGLDAEAPEGFRWLGAPLAPDVVAQHDPTRQVIADFASLPVRERERLAAQAEQAHEKWTSDPAHHPAAVAHFAGFWADESEVGADDARKVRCGSAARPPAQGCSGGVKEAHGGRGWEPVCVRADARVSLLSQRNATSAFASTPFINPFAKPPQVYVGDFIEVDDDSCDAKRSVARIQHLYQDAAVRERAEGSVMAGRGVVGWDEMAGGAVAQVGRLRRALPVLLLTPPASHTTPACLPACLLPRATA